MGVDLLLEVDLAEVRRKIDPADWSIHAAGRRAMQGTRLYRAHAERTKYRGSQVALAHPHGSEIIEAMPSSWRCR